MCEWLNKEAGRSRYVLELQGKASGMRRIILKVDFTKKYELG
jgi:hypothetical protein